MKPKSKACIINQPSAVVPPPQEQNFNKHALALSFKVFLLSRLVLVLVLYFCGLFFKGSYIGLLTTRWDSLYFYRIALDLSQAGGAFYPFYPILIKIFSLNGVFSIAYTALILNQIMFFISLYYLYLYLNANELFRKNAQFGLILLSLSPMSIFFVASYSETTFLMLSIMALYYLQQNKTNIAIMCGFFLTATRPTGMAFSIAFFYTQYRKNGFNFKLIYQTLLSCGGFIIYYAYGVYISKDFLHFLHVEAAWGRTGWISPDILESISFLISQIKMEFLPNDVAFLRDGIAFFFSLFLSVILWRKKLTAEAIFNLFCILPGFILSSKIHGVFNSSARLDMAIITFTLGLLLLCKNELTKYFIIACSSIFLLQAYIMWIIGWLD